MCGRTIVATQHHRGCHDARKTTCRQWIVSQASPDAQMCSLEIEIPESSRRFQNGRFVKSCVRHSRRSASSRPCGTDKTERDRRRARRAILGLHLSTGPWRIATRTRLRRFWRRQGDECRADVSGADHASWVMRRDAGSPNPACGFCAPKTGANDGACHCSSPMMYPSWHLICPGI